MLLIDLTGHGKSKAERTKFTMKVFGKHVVAEMQFEKLSKVILVDWSISDNKNLLSIQCFW